MMPGKAIVATLLCGVCLSPVWGDSQFYRGSAVSEAYTPFGVLVFDLAAGDPATEGGGDLFFNSLDAEPTTFNLIGLSWDELYRFNPVSGETTRLGPIKVFNAVRQEFLNPAYPDPYAYTSTADATSTTFVVDITVSFYGFDGEMQIYQETTFHAEHTQAPPYGTDTVNLVTESVSYDSAIYGTQTVDLIVDLHFDNNEAWVLFDNTISHLWTIAVSGMVRSTTERADHATDGISLPMRAITVSPQYKIIGLSDQWYDPSGYPQLYRLNLIPGIDDSENPGELITGSQYVEAVPLVRLDTQGIDTLEWATGTDGTQTLYGTGNGKAYSINTDTGACTEISEIQQVLVDLDSTLAGLVNGLTYDELNLPAIVGVNHESSTPVPCPDCAPLWGYTTFTYSNADIDQDWDVDLNDFSLFAGCIAGPAMAPPAGCTAADIDMDGDVDLADFSFFQAAFNR